MTHFKLSPKQKAARVFSYLFMALCVLVALFPIVWVVLSSFKTNREILSNGCSCPALSVSPAISRLWRWLLF